MKIERRTLFYTILFIVLIILFLSYASYGYFNYQHKQQDFRTYKISGHIVKLKLITTFPNEGLYVGFDTGDFRFIDINYWWAYSHLSLIQPYNNVTLTYERNYYGNTRLLHIQETVSD